MRVLVIETDPLRREAIQHRINSWNPDVEVILHNPLSQGTLAPEFRALGFDAVVLARLRTGGNGLDWVKDLAGRPGFAPVVFLSECTDDADARTALSYGACAALGCRDLGSDRFTGAIDEAGQKQSLARAVWRSSPPGREAQRFGHAFIRGYRCIRRLAGGPVSDLYLAESEAAGKLVAIKVTRDRHQDQSDLDHTFRRFLQEYEIVQRIRHPNIVRLFDLGISDEHAWLVMEFFRAGDLRKRMRAGMRPRPAIRTAINIARALQAIHASGVLHRDLKPGNVMLRDDGSLALIDFGMSKDTALAQEVTDTGLIFGTPHYMSPEQGHGEPIDARSDLYSLGVMMFEMLAHRKPFMAENPMAIIYKHRKEPVPRLPERFAKLQPLIEKFLAKEPAARFGDAGEAAEALQQAYRQLVTAKRAG